MHGEQCEFWNGFADIWDQKHNFFEALSDYSGKTIFLMDNAPADFIDEAANSKAVQIIKGRYLRDARAITASYARKMADKGISYEQSIQPDNWFYPSFMSLPSFVEMQNSYEFVIRYEDAVRDQSQALQTVGKVLGITYDDSSFQFWEFEHHITVGNQGPIAMVKLHQLGHMNDFESKPLYQKQLKRLKENPTKAFSDERWKEQLTNHDRLEFDRLMGNKNGEFGYPRDYYHSGNADPASDRLRFARLAIKARTNKLLQILKRMIRTIVK